MEDPSQDALPCPKMVYRQEELTPEQTAYAQQFAQARIAAMLSTAAIDEQAAEEHLRQAYRMVGCRPPQIRWFDSPVPFVLAHFPPNLLDRIRKRGRVSLSASVWKQVEASTLVTVGRSMGWYHLPPVWPFTKDTMRYQIAMSEWKGVGDAAEAPITESVWQSVEENVSARVEQSLGGIIRQVECSVRSSLPGGEDRIWRSMEEIAQRLVCGSMNTCANAYAAQSWLALAYFFHKIFEPNASIHLVRMNEMVSAYRLGREEAWLVRKPIWLEQDEQEQRQNGDGLCVQYGDGWGFGTWHGARRSVQEA